MLLEIRGLTVAFNRVTALSDVSIALDDQPIVAILGANGAGKTTCLRTISGLHKPAKGEIRFDGRRIDAMPAEKIVAAGIAHVPEGRRIFPDMTAEENLRTGAFLRTDAAGIDADLARIFGLFPRLSERKGQWAKTMSGGEQQMLAIGRALMAKPKLLLLDEPSMGLAPVVVEQIVRIIEEISAQGVHVILVEQNADMALALADYAYVFESGKMVLEGEARSLMENHDRLRKIYLGG